LAHKCQSNEDAVSDGIFFMVNLKMRFEPNPFLDMTVLHGSSMVDEDKGRLKYMMRGVR